VTTTPGIGERGRQLRTHTVISRGAVKRTLFDTRPCRKFEPCPGYQLIAGHERGPRPVVERPADVAIVLVRKGKVDAVVLAHGATSDTMGGPEWSRRRLGPAYRNPRSPVCPIAAHSGTGAPSRRA
jgi:hypothetical protein